MTITADGCCALAETHQNNAFSDKVNEWVVRTDMTTWRGIWST